MKSLFKKNLFWSILLVIYSCNQNAEKSKATDEREVLFPLGTIGYKIYHNPKCPAKFTSGDLVIEFLKGKYEKKDSVYGKAYYSDNSLKNIAVCNNLGRELILSIYGKSKLIYKVSGKAVDTIYFAYPFPSHTEIDSVGRQKIKAHLRTSYSIADEREDHYDTAMIRTFYFNAE